MNVSAVSAAHPIRLAQAAQATARPAPAATAAVDSDGDHDGSTARAGRLDVKA